MKKRYKALLLSGSILAGAAISNYAIFKLTKDKPLSSFNEYNYKFNFGNINYTVHGKGSPLLLIHGVYVGANYKEWEKNIISLSKHYKVYALDLLGFGASDKPAITYSPYLYVTLINSFINDVIKEAPYVIASTDSCSFATISSLFDSSKINKLILVSPKETNYFKSAFKSNFLRKLIESPVIGTSIYNIMCSKLILRNYLQKHYANPSHVNNLMVDAYYHLSHYKGVNVKYPVASYLGGDLDGDIYNNLNKINVPVHIIWGEECENDLIYNYDKIKSINTNIDISIIKDSKTLPHNEKPKEFYKVVREFFI